MGFHSQGGTSGSTWVQQGQVGIYSQGARWRVGSVDGKLLEANTEVRWILARLTQQVLVEGRPAWGMIWSDIEGNQIQKCGRVLLNWFSKNLTQTLQGWRGKPKIRPGWAEETFKFGQKKASFPAIYFFMVLSRGVEIDSSLGARNSAAMNIPNFPPASMLMFSWACL